MVCSSGSGGEVGGFGAGSNVAIDTSVLEDTGAGSDDTGVGGAEGDDTCVGGAEGDDTGVGGAVWGDPGVGIGGSVGDLGIGG